MEILVIQVGAIPTISLILIKGDKRMKKKDFVGKTVSCRTVDSFGRVSIEYTPIKKVSGKQLISKDSEYICDITQLGTEVVTPTGTKSFELVG